MTKPKSRCSRAAPKWAAAFSTLAFDHLLFTGATSVAYHVMRAAAENLVPTTLELGGKSPVVIGKSADMKLVANRVMMGKTLNAGPDLPRAGLCDGAEGSGEGIRERGGRARSRRCSRP